MSKLRVDEMEFGLSPRSNPLSYEEEKLFRDILSSFLTRYLSFTSPERIVPDEWLDISYLGLSRARDNTLEGENVLKYSVSGILFFYSIPDGGTEQPTEEDFLDWIRKEVVKPDLILEDLKNASVNGTKLFQDLERVTVWQDFYQPSTALPTLAPTVPSATIVPTTNPNTIATVTSVRQIDDFVGTTVGIIFGGLCGLLLLIILGLFIRRRRNKQNVDDITTPQKSNRPEGQSESPNCKTVCSEDDEDSCVQLHEPLGIDHQIVPENRHRRRLYPWENYFNNNSRYAMEEMSCGSSIFDEEESFGNGDSDKQMVRIQPHIVVVREKSFLSEPERKVACLKKDMLESSALTMATTSNNPKSILGLPPSVKNDDDCVLEPTDVSAAKLSAMSSNSNQTSRLSTQTTGGSSGSNSAHSTYLVPKIANGLWRNSSSAATATLKEESGSVDEYSNFGIGEWDPDDCSSQASVADNNNGEMFVTKSTNPAEQSLLNHSLRSESYKMQRLRTPDNQNTLTRTYSDEDMLWV